MNVYIYQADVFCEDCGKKIREHLKAAFKAPADPSNENSYDSDNYPKGPITSDKSDCPQHCGAGEECVNAVDLGGETGKVGMMLENDLTPEGVEYLKDYIRTQPDNPVVKMQAEFYKDKYDLTVNADE